MLKIIRSRLRLKTRVGVWYDPAYIASIKCTSDYERYTIKRAKKILSTLRHDFLLFAGDLKNAPLAKWSELELFHTRDYLKETTQSSVAFIPLGIELSEEEQESILETERHMVGGTLEATKAVIGKKIKVAFNLGGGLHHAEPSSGTGFCLFNDIGVSIRYLRRHQHFDDHILIIDLDYHQGNGNMLGLIDDPNTFHYSLQGHKWKEISGPNIFEINLPPHATDEEYLTALKNSLTSFYQKVKPKLVYFVAGTDVLKHDHFGAFHLSLLGVFERDKFVVDFCKKNKVPMVITLGGGYSEKAWESSYYLLRYLLTNQAPLKNKVIIDQSNKYYARIAKKLHKNQLGQGLDLELSQDDLFPARAQKASNKAFGIYSKSGIDMAMERYGFKKKLATIGHPHLQLDLHTESDGSSLLRIFSLLHYEKHLIIETKLSTQVLFHPELENLRLMKIDWLLTQNPLRKFSKERPPFPGQKYPGIGFSKDIIHIFIQACKRLDYDGISHNPIHFHIALKTCHDFHYLNPQTEGQLMALESFLLPYTLIEATKLAEEKRIKNNKEEAVWPLEGEIIYPVSSKIIQYFESKEYIEAVRFNYQKSLDEKWTIH